MTPYGISRQLEADGDLSPSHKPKWNAPTVRRILSLPLAKGFRLSGNAPTVKRILSNEKYKGDALLQKTYTVDYLTKKTKVNNGEIPQYYVEGDHEAIIDPAVFDRVQIELEKRCSGKNRYPRRKQIPLEAARQPDRPGKQMVQAQPEQGRRTH